ncbi:MAG: FlgB family protein [Paracoccaceae bacterium]
MENLTVLQLASAMARHAAVRHSVLAENVANADTPGYRARDVESFSEIVNEAFTMHATRPGHHDRGGPVLRAADPRRVDAEFAAGPNGNSVNLEDQAVRATEAQGQHALALAVYRKATDILRVGLGRSR